MAAIAIGLIPTWAAACGNATQKSTSSSSEHASLTPATAASMHTATAPLAAPQRPGISDTYDQDDHASRALEQGDDREIEVYGRPATAAEWRAATAFVHNYYRFAAAENGAAACSLFTPRLRESMGGGQYDKPGNPSYLRGKTCPEVMTKLFKHRHKLMSSQAAGLEVTDVRVTTRTTFILLAYKGIRERRYMGVERVGNTLQLEALIDSKYP